MPGIVSLEIYGNQVELEIGLRLGQCKWKRCYVKYVWCRDTDMTECRTNKPKI